MEAYPRAFVGIGFTTGEEGPAISLGDSLRSVNIRVGALSRGNIASPTRARSRGRLSGGTGSSHRNTNER